MAGSWAATAECDLAKVLFRSYNPAAARRETPVQNQSSRGSGLLLPRLLSRDFWKSLTPEFIFFPFRGIYGKVSSLKGAVALVPGSVGSGIGQGGLPRGGGGADPSGSQAQMSSVVENSPLFARLVYI